MIEAVDAYLDWAINPDSGPGVPLMFLSATDSELVREHRNLIHRCVNERMQLLLSEDHRSLSPEELVARGVVDPVRLFIKNEPHPPRKFKSGKMRLISSVSLIDQLIERLLCGEQNACEIANWHRIPSKPGMGLDSKENRDLVRAAVREDAAEADVSGWDWSVQGWELAWEAEARIQLSSLPPPLALAMRNRFHCVANTVFVEPGGFMFAQVVPGIQLSGCYNTSSSNSRMRVMAAHLIGAKWCFAMGDDCVEQYVPDAAQKYAALGHVVRMYRKAHPTAFEFCSHKFFVDRSYPVTAGKSLFRILSKDWEERDLEQFAAYLIDHADKGKLIALASLGSRL